MTLADAVPAVLSWSEPDGLAARGTVVVVPGRGEQPGLYERFGRRLAADAYRVLVVADPTVDERATRDQIGAALTAGPHPLVLAGSDSGALFAAGLVAGAALPVDGLLLAGLPVEPAAHLPASDRADKNNRADEDDWADKNGRLDQDDWDAEVQARTACPTHQGRLNADGAVRHGALREALPGEWFDRADPGAVGVPVLGLHGADDVVSPLAAARDWYVKVPVARLVSVAGGRHDALNDQTHRSAAAETVLFLERLRLGADLPAIVRVEIGAT